MYSLAFRLNILYIYNIFFRLPQFDDFIDLVLKTKKNEDSYKANTNNRNIIVSNIIQAITMNNILLVIYNFIIYINIY